MAKIRNFLATFLKPELLWPKAKHKQTIKFFEKISWAKFVDKEDKKAYRIYLVSLEGLWSVLTKKFSRIKEPSSSPLQFESPTSTWVYKNICHVWAQEIQRRRILDNFVKISNLRKLSYVTKCFKEKNTRIKAKSQGVAIER